MQTFSSFLPRVFECNQKGDFSRRQRLFGHINLEDDPQVNHKGKRERRRVTNFANNRIVERTPAFAAWE